MKFLHQLHFPLAITLLIVGCDFEASPVYECHPGESRSCPDGYPRIGRCINRMQVCTDQGRWPTSGECIGDAPWPVEVCGNGIDDDCDPDTHDDDCPVELSDSDDLLEARSRFTNSVIMRVSPRLGRPLITAREAQLPSYELAKAYLSYHAADFDLDPSRFDQQFTHVTGLPPERLELRQYHDLRPDGRGIPVAGGRIRFNLQARPTVQGGVSRVDWQINSVYAAHVPFDADLLPTGDELDHQLMAASEVAGRLRVALDPDGDGLDSQNHPLAPLGQAEISPPLVLAQPRRNGQALHPVAGATDREAADMGEADRGAADTGEADRETTQALTSAYCIEPRIVRRIETPEQIYFVDTLREPGPFICPPAGPHPLIVETNSRLDFSRCGRLVRSDAGSGIDDVLWRRDTGRSPQCVGEAECRTAELIGHTLQIFSDFADEVLSAPQGLFDFVHVKLVERLDGRLVWRPAAPGCAPIGRDGPVDCGEHDQMSCDAPQHSTIEVPGNVSTRDLPWLLGHEMTHGWLDVLHPETAGLGDSIEQQAIEEGVATVLGILAQCRAGETCIWPETLYDQPACPLPEPDGSPPHIECDDPPEWPMWCRWECRSSNQDYGHRLGDLIVRVAQAAFVGQRGGQTNMAEAARWAVLWGETARMITPGEATLTAFGQLALATCYDMSNWYASGVRTLPMTWSDCDALRSLLASDPPVVHGDLLPDNGPRPELCDGLDNDQDGATDNAVLHAGDACIRVEDLGGWTSILESDAWHRHCPPYKEFIWHGNSIIVPATLPDACQELLRTGSCALGSTQCVSGIYTCQMDDERRGRASEHCNGKDDDCDGLVDEAPTDVWLSEQCSTGDEGVCGLGRYQCIDGSKSCEHSMMPRVEYCNNRDDDCDGELDEGALHLNEMAEATVGDDCASGLPGVCATGDLHCDQGQLVCVARIGPDESRGEQCNGLDDDCDGITDEADNMALVNNEAVCLSEDDRAQWGRFASATGCTLPGGVGPAEGIIILEDPACVRLSQLGTCSPGRLTCLEGSYQCDPSPLSDGSAGEFIAPADEICDGLDNNCNGEPDEDYNLAERACLSDEWRDEWPTWDGDGPDPCANMDQRGSVYLPDEACVARLEIANCQVGSLSCHGGEPQCAAETMVLPIPEVCNGRNDDCDGETDEDIEEVGQPCELDAPEGGCQAGNWACVGGGLVCEPQRRPEACNGLDDDCDGITDEDIRDEYGNRVPCIWCNGAQEPPCNGCVDTLLPDGYSCIPTGQMLFGSERWWAGRWIVNMPYTFLIARHETTRSEWMALMDAPPPMFESDCHPNRACIEQCAIQWSNCALRCDAENEYSGDCRLGCGEAAGACEQECEGDEVRPCPRACLLGECPVSGVTWFEAARFANAKSRSEGYRECYALDELDCEFAEGPFRQSQWVCSVPPNWLLYRGDCGYRLPTQAEFFYAGYGVSRQRLEERPLGMEDPYSDIPQNFWWGEGRGDIGGHCWHRWNALQVLHPVGGTIANGFGLYDIHGNVSEMAHCGPRMWTGTIDRGESHGSPHHHVVDGMIQIASAPPPCAEPQGAICRQRDPDEAYLMGGDISDTPPQLYEDGSVVDDSLTFTARTEDCIGLGQVHHRSGIRLVRSIE